MRGRPNLYTEYKAEMGLFPSMSKKIAIGLLALIAILGPLAALPFLGFAGDASWLILVNKALVFAIAALGINLLTGVAGQVSLGHAFFMAVGAYTAVVLGGEAGNTVWGLGLPIWIWLPAAGVAAALIGVFVAPTAVRVRGLYLAFVTLGLVFIGLYLWRNLGKIAGGPGTGRPWPELEFALWRNMDPLVSFTSDGPLWWWLTPVNWLPWVHIEEMDGEVKTFFFLVVLVAVFAIIAKNLMRTRIGRSWAAIRDRDIAAEVMGVADAKGKTQAFGISSFYAGMGGALFASVVGRIIPESWDIFLSVEFVAIILIGGAGTIVGTFLGTFFVVLSPRIVENVTGFLATQAEDGGPFSWLGSIFVRSSADDWIGIVSYPDAAGPGLSVAQLNIVLFGVLIVVFLIAEPLGLYGIWLRARNYWKGWPFTY
ncbi:MAG: branched-chain amino acid ABC transporter permease [Actinomycetota bacterium]|nr:branched-chain amino acid ABC transporter permease [Actinomycetota bacterium]